MRGRYQCEGQVCSEITVSSCAKFIGVDVHNIEGLLADNEGGVVLELTMPGMKKTSRVYQAVCCDLAR